MTDLKEAPAEPTGGTDRARKLKIAAGAAAVGIVVLGFGVWYFLIRDTSAAAVDSAAAADAREEALAEAGDEPAPTDDSGTTDESDTAADPAPVAAGIDGTWTVDTSIGVFDEVCLTDVCNAAFLGFRINEELASVGAKTVVGRTPGVLGTMDISGTTINSLAVSADMTLLLTDSGSRTNAIRSQAIETTLFPQASFVLSEPIDIGAIPGAGERIQVEATGELTIHGVTRTETIPLTAELSGDVIVVFGQLGPILLADYEINKPTAAAVLSVEDNAIMELQLFFRRSG